MLLEYLTWMHDFNKSDREIVNAKQQIIDTQGFNWKETIKKMNSVAKNNFITSLYLFSNYDVILPMTPSAPLSR